MLHQLSMSSELFEQAVVEAVLEAVLVVPVVRQQLGHLRLHPAVGL